MEKEARAASAGSTEALPLRARSVASFLEAVASTKEPVPAGGSVAALCGAAAAGLLALVCAVRAKRHPSVELDALGARARRLQAQLTQLVDDDASAYRDLLAARRAAKAQAAPSAQTDASGQAGASVQTGPNVQAAARAAQVPIDIAARCQDVLVLAEQVAPHAAGAMAGDARTAALLAAAAAEAALGLADEDAMRTPDARLRHTLEQQIAALRQRP